VAAYVKRLLRVGTLKGCVITLRLRLPVGSRVVFTLLLRVVNIDLCLELLCPQINASNDGHDLGVELIIYRLSFFLLLATRHAYLVQLLLVDRD
jgi:hypothetical protein